MRLPEQLVEAADPDAFDPAVYIDRTGGSAQDAVEKWLRQAGFRRTHQQRSSRVVTYQKKLGYRFISLTRTLDSVGGTFDPIWAVGHYSPHMKHAGVRQSNLRAFVSRLLAGDTEVFSDAQLVSESADPDAFDPNVYIDRTGAEAQAATEDLLLGMGAKKLSENEFVYDDLHMVRGPVGIDPVWTVHWNSWFRTWPETRGIAKVLQSRLQDFVNEYQRLIDDDYDHKRAFTLAREHLKESVDPDDPASFISRVEQPEDVLRELGFVNLKHQPVWSRDDGSVRTVVEKADATHWRITSWMPGSKRTLPVMKEFDWFDLRKGIEWALPRTAKWARPGSTDWAVKLAHGALGEAADPDDIDPQQYLSGAVDPVFAKLIEMGFERVPETHADVEHVVMMLNQTPRGGGTFIKVYADEGGTSYYARLCDEADNLQDTVSSKQGWRIFAAVRRWLKDNANRLSQMRESADPDDINPQHYLDGLSTHELLDTSTPASSSRSTCCTCGKWCFSGLVRDEAERLDFENNLRTEWERHRAFATERVEPASRDYMLKVGAPYRWNESTDPDDINFDSYVLNSWEELLRSKGFKYQPKGIPYWYRVQGKLATCIRQSDREPGTLEVTKYRVGVQWEQIDVPSHIPVKKLYLVIESADPDDIDPQRYMSAIRVVWVIKWNDAYYEAHSHSHGQFAGGEWKLKPDHATRWTSREAAEAWFEKNLRPWYQNAEVVPVQRRLSESADPDDINPEHYLDAVASTAGPLELRARLQAAFRGAFMRPEYYFSGYHEVETNVGTYIVPAEVMDSDDPDDYLDYVEGRINEVSERREGWVYRTSASGYMDATDWGAAESEEEAIEALIDNYGDQDAEIEESVDPDDVDPSKYLAGAVPPVTAVFTLDDGDGTSFSVDAADYLNKRQKQWMKNLRIHANLSGTPAVGVDFEYTEPDLAALSTLRLPAEAYARMRDYECGGVLEIDRDALERWWARRSVRESADPDDVDPKQWLDSIALSRERLREIIRGIPKNFHIGFSIRTSDENTVKEDAAERGVELTDDVWTALLRDIDLIERNVRKWMDAHGIDNRSEGHDGDGDLVGSIFLDLAAPSNFAFFEQYMQHEEPWSTSSGTFPHDADVYADTSEFAHLLDVDLDLFDYDKCEVAFEHMVDSGVTVKKLNGVWTGVSPARDVEEAADPDEPDMARWVEKLSAEAQLNRIFNEQGTPYFRGKPNDATNWSRWFRWGEIEVWSSFTLFHKGAPGGLLSYEIRREDFRSGGGVHKNSELVHGPDNILKMIELFDRALAGLNQNPPKKTSDVIRAFETPLRWAYSMERYGEDTA